VAAKAARVAVWRCLVELPPDLDAGSVERITGIWDGYMGTLLSHEIGETLTNEAEAAVVATAERLDLSPPSRIRGVPDPGPAPGAPIRRNDPGGDHRLGPAGTRLREVLGDGTTPDSRARWLTFVPVALDDRTTDPLAVARATAAAVSW
jgi:hypothetical protein